MHSKYTHLQYVFLYYIIILIIQVEDLNFFISLLGRIHEHYSVKNANRLLTS